MTKTTLVAAGVLLNAQEQFLLSSRPKGKPYAGYWEFPGGKIESGESVIQALERELIEELGIHIQSSTPWLSRRFVYPHASVVIHFYRVWQWSGELQSCENQQFIWQLPNNISVKPVLPSSEPILRALKLPSNIYQASAKELDASENQNLPKNKYLLLDKMPNCAELLRQRNNCLTLEQSFAGRGADLIYTQVSNVEQLTKAALAGCDFGLIDAPHSEILSIINIGSPIPLFATKAIANWRSIGLHGYVDLAWRG